MLLRVSCCCASLVLGIALLTSASSITPHRTNEESLKSALDAVTRKQRSLDFPSSDYYDLQNFKYHPNDDDNDEIFPRQQNHDLDDNDEDLEFLPYENGQLENIGEGYQNFNNKRLERALMDYFENSSGQRETAPTSFRERARTGGHKRNAMNDRPASMNDFDKDLAALLYKELQKGPLYGDNNDNIGDIDNQDYQLSNTLQQAYYDRYLADKPSLNGNNRINEMNSDPMLWGEIFAKQEASRNRNNNKKIMEAEGNEDEDDKTMINGDFGNRDRDRMYLLPTERRNVNGRYPIGRDNGVTLTRYPLTKRSLKPLQHERETSGDVITDPKVAKDLGSLFGSPKTDAKHKSTKNESSITNNNDNPDNDHSRDHDHDHHPGHNHDHSGHDHDTLTVSTPRDDLRVTSSESPRTSIASSRVTSGQEEMTNGDNGRAGKLLSKRAEQRKVELTKKSVDWSQYFGIDRRKKKAALLARPGTQDLDDEWMLQRYYKTMAENLKTTENGHPDKDNGEKRDKLDQMDTRLKNVKNLILEDALKYGNEGNPDGQDVKDVVMTRLAAAYSLEKMRMALNEFRNNIAAQRELMRAAHANDKYNETKNLRDRIDDEKDVSDNSEKRSGHEIYENDENNEARNYEGFDEGKSCPALESIVRSCPGGAPGLSGLQELCIMHQICRACDDTNEDCSSMFAYGANKICERAPIDPRRCVRIVSKFARRPLMAVVASCHSGTESCLRQSYRYRHRAIYYQNSWPPHLALDPLQLAAER